MKYAVEMGLFAMTPGFVKTGSGVRKLTKGIHRQHGDLISLLFFYQNKESMVKDIVNLLVFVVAV
jgi:hypothetical protein